MRFACKTLVTGGRDIYRERKWGSAESRLPGVRLARGSTDHTTKTSMGGEVWRPELTDEGGHAC